MNRGLEAVSHPSLLALEALLAGEADALATRHVVTCPSCQRQLAAMEQSVQSYSASPRSLEARARAQLVDARWKRRAALVALAPLLLAALLAWPRPVEPSPTPLVARAPLAALPRHGREVLSPRDEPWRANLRALSVRGREVQLGQGALEAAGADGVPRPFTLRHTKVDLEVTGFVQAVTVTQTFENPFSVPVEAVYVFPLPEDAAVHDLCLVAGARTLRAVIQRREVAREQYERAKAEGRRAALLDQERPNLFTQSLANLLPGERVEVTLSYVAPLRFDDGVYTLNFPMTVGPRYVPGAVLPGEAQGTGVAPDTDVVPDGSRVSPPPTRSGRDVEVSVKLNAGTVIEDLWSVSHLLEVDRPSAREARLSLDPADTVPNKDLVVRWRVAGDEARAAMLAGGGAFALQLHPERSGASLPVTPKELVFVIDTSGSMQGAPLEAAKRAMALALEQLQPLDTFQLIDFAAHARAYRPAPVPATQENLAGALRYLRALPSGGSTNQLAGLRRALARPEDPERLRVVLLMTDGFIGNEEEILAEAMRLRGAARVFGFGVGSSVNHYLLSRLSEEGRGAYQYVRPDEDPTEAVQRFARRVRRPLLTDLSIDWGGLPVADTLPTLVPDLFDGQPLIIHGRYRAPASGTVTLRGKRAGLPVTLEVPVTLPALDTPGRALTMAWARQRLEQLSTLMHGRERPEVIEQVVTLGLEHHLVTKYTSLVAVDSAVVTGSHGLTVAEPTLAPDQRGAAAALGALSGKAAGGLVGLGFSGVGGLGLRGAGSGGGGLGGSGVGATGSGVGAGGGVGTRGAGLSVLGGSGVGDTRGASRADPVPRKDVHRETSPRADEKPRGHGENHGAAPSDPYRGNAALLRRHRRELESCVERQALIDPSLTGVLVVRWVVDPDGSTRDVVVLTKALAHGEAARCIAARVLRWRYPAHADGARTAKFSFAL